MREDFTTWRNLVPRVFVLLDQRSEDESSGRNHLQENVKKTIWTERSCVYFYETTIVESLIDHSRPQSLRSFWPPAGIEIIRELWEQPF